MYKIIFIICALLIAVTHFIAPSPTAILIHGCHLQTKNWEDIMFGNQELDGRVTAGVREAFKQKAKVIIWGSGASTTKEGIHESRYTFEQAIHSHLHELAHKMRISPSRLLHFLQNISLIEIKAKNTKEEIDAAFHACIQNKIHSLTLVSSPTHIARCFQEALKQKIKPEYKDLLVYATASDVCFANTTAEDVIIIEPPHRIDRPQIPVHKIARKILTLFQKEEAFSAELTDLMERYQPTE